MKPAHNHRRRPGLAARSGKRLRAGMAALEVVLTTAAIIPALFALTYLGIRLCRTLFSLAGSMVGLPYM